MDRKRLFKAALIWSLLLTNLFTGLAQETTRKDQHYIDILIGRTINISKYQHGNRADNLIKRNNDDMFLSLRYTYYPLKHWGIFADIQSPYIYYGELTWNYWEQLEETHYIKEKKDWAESSGISFNFGIAYRKETKKWSFRPRIGFGSSANINNSFSFLLKEVDSNGIYRITVSSKDSPGECIRIPCISSGISINLKVHQHIYLTADASYSQLIKRPSFIYEKEDLYSGQITELGTYRPSHLGRCLNLSVGVCVPIYFNKRKAKQKVIAAIPLIQSLPNP